MKKLDLKSFLKSLKLNESTISMLLGALVIVVVGFLVVNYFRNLNESNTLPSISTEEIALPTTHTVEEGEDLWKISEIYYNSGYNWVDIASANNLTDPGVIGEGQELTIPDVESKQVGTEIAAIETEVTPTKIQIATPTEKPEKLLAISTESEIVETQLPISGATYTVVRGDTLWDIAVRAYGDGFRWTDIAKENELVNPHLIHAGNKFILPR